MSHMRLTIDGEVLFDGELNDWAAKPPAELVASIKPGAKPAPHMKAVMITLSDAALSGRDTAIDVKTKPGSWVMTVETAEPPEPAEAAVDAA